MDPLRSSLSRAEAARALGIPITVIDALVTSGAVRCKGEAIPASQLETLFRDALLRLYRADAAPPPVKAEEPEIAIEAEPLITHNIAEYNAASAETEKPEMRIAVRYMPRRQIGGAFNQVRFTLLQISNTGLRIRHTETLLPGEEAKLTLSLQKPARTFHMRARVVWTSIAQRGDDPTFCISGLRVTDDADRLREAVTLMRDARELAVDEKSAKVERKETPQPLRSVSDDEVAAILKALRRLTSDPIEANRWYNRARFALSEPQVRRAAPVRAADREQVLGIWEYLERRIDIGKIAGVVNWSHGARAAAV
jgi:PilZ domain